MLTIAEVSDDYGIESVTAKMPFESSTKPAFDIINLRLSEGSGKEGKWVATWAARDTIRNYINQKIKITNML
jgi:hypothetical protein